MPTSTVISTGFATSRSHCARVFTTPAEADGEGDGAGRADGDGEGDGDGDTEGSPPIHAVTDDSQRDDAASRAATLSRHASCADTYDTHSG